MDEAEALSDRIMILSKGRMQAIGNSFYLKEKFADYYSVFMTFADEFGEAGMEILEKNFGEKITKMKNYSNCVRFSADFTVVKGIFKLMSPGGEFEGKVEDWEFNQPSLDDVFMTLAEKRG